VDDVAFLPALEQARLVAAGELSPVEIVQTYLERIDRLDGALNAYVTVCAEQALADARAAEKATGDLPPFHGVPIAVKDLAMTAGVRTTLSCRAYAEFVPDFDAAVVRRLKEAGFILLGKTNTPEFGTIAFTESDLNGACRNPWNLERTPGGSSGGATAALAAGLCPAAQGGDGGGSIRIPASCCGVFGIKPSRGRVSSAPSVPFAGLSTLGPITRTVADAAALLDVMSGYEPGDPFWPPDPERPFAEEVGAPPGRLRIAVTASPPSDVPVDAACRAALDDAARLLAELGHDVVEATPPWGDGFGEAFVTVWQALPTLYPVEDESLLTPLNRYLAARARATPSDEYLAALQRLQTLARSVVAFWADVDVVVTPTLALPPVPIGWMFELPVEKQLAPGGRFSPFTAIANATGQPAVSVPLSWSEEGLPIGVQLIGPPSGEALLIRVSAQLEEARPWADRRPPHA
jgi:amidase